LIDAIGQAAGTLDRNQLLHMITENACRLVDAERSSIFLVDPATKEMIFQVSFHSPDRPATGPLAAGAARLGRPRPANRPQEEFSFFSRSGITVPLTNGPVSPDQETDRKRTLGGLMALNKQGQSFQEDDADLLSILAEQASSFLQVVELYESTGELFVDVIKSFVTAIDAKDPYTQGHSQRVSDYSVMIAQELGLSDTQVNDIRVSSLLHDIGKIGVSDTILKKAGRLTPAEYEEIKQHPTIGANILSQVKALAPVLPGILEHHERLNGAGYPQCLQGAQISLMGRIIAVADVFDAMTSHRPYRPALSVAEVIAYLKENIGVQFDADCVRALENILIRSYEAD
jgi:putative nucleotidyltransferase with HDIG domain